MKYFPDHHDTTMLEKRAASGKGWGEGTSEEANHALFPEGLLLSQSQVGEKGAKGEVLINILD